MDGGSVANRGDVAGTSIVSVTPRCNRCQEMVTNDSLAHKFLITRNPACRAFRARCVIKEAKGAFAGTKRGAVEFECLLNRYQTGVLLDR